MFSKISRYRKELDVVTVDAKGRALASKRLRLLPEVSGALSHTIEDGERLDHLAYKYYKQPRSWWRLVDANPAFLSPQALLGNEPRATVQISLAWDGSEPPWTGLLQALRRERGVETALQGTPEQALPDVEYIDGAPDFTLNGAVLVATLQDLADFLRPEGPPGARLTEEALLTLLQNVLTGLGVMLSGAVGLLPVEINRWRLVEEETGQVYTFQLDEEAGVLNVFETAVRYGWVVTVTYHTDTLTDGDLITLIEGFPLIDSDPRRFAAEVLVTVRRLGKSIVIPPRAT